MNSDLYSLNRMKSLQWVFIFLFVLSASILPAEESHMAAVGADVFFTVLEESRDEGSGVLIDVRTPGEYSNGHAPASVNIDFYGEDFRDRIDNLDRNEVYFLYCRSGNRSGRTLKLMKELGFQNAYSLSGGWMRNSSRLLGLKES
jgi:rhodanese-related sulfurtransferase